MRMNGCKSTIYQGANKCLQTDNFVNELSNRRNRQSTNLQRKKCANRQAR